MVPTMGSVVGEVTEAIVAHLAKGWVGESPSIHENFSQPDRDGTPALFVALYRLARGAGSHSCRRPEVLGVPYSEASEVGAKAWVARPPLRFDAYYAVAASARHRSDAERILGAALVRLGEIATLVDRPRRFFLETGACVDSNGAPWSPTTVGVARERVGLALVDDLDVHGAAALFAAWQAPWRPYVTWKASVALDGPTTSRAPTRIHVARLEPRSIPPKQSE